MKTCFPSLRGLTIGYWVQPILLFVTTLTSAQTDWLAYNKDGISVVIRTVEVKHDKEVTGFGTYDVYAYDITATVTNGSGRRIKLPDGLLLTNDRADCLSHKFANELGLPIRYMNSSAQLSAGVMAPNESASATGYFISRCKPFLPGLYKFNYIFLNDPQRVAPNPPLAGIRPANSGGNPARKPSNQPRRISYGNDVKCLNCGSEGNPSLPPPNQSKSRGIPYGNDSKCLNCGSESRITLPPPGQSQSYVQASEVDRTEADDNDDISKIDSSDPEEVLKWTMRQAEKAIKELDELARLTKCPATATAYRRLAEYSRCALKGGDCGLPPTADIPDCPADI